MDESCCRDHCHDRRHLLNRARRIVLWALPQYDLEWEWIRYIGMSDSVTYQIQTRNAGRFLLRIHRAQVSESEIRSELMLLRMLNGVLHFPVPEGIPGIGGDDLLAVAGEEPEFSWVTLMRWVEGEEAAKDLTEPALLKMGKMMGRLHQAAAQFNPPAGFTRPVWGAESFRGEMIKLEHHYPGFLSKKAWKSYQAAAAKIIAELEKMDVSNDTYGLIHADLHSGNVVFHGDEPHPIDFGRCGYGYYLYDMAGSLLELYPDQRKVFIEGYESVMKLEADYARKLESFFIMVMIGNYCHYAPIPEEAARLREEQPYAQAYIREYLQGTPFVFKRIEPAEA
ncbi:phosphotransferase enzyme family protein [Paenibacillus graminis]|uniref:Aminoglycoside phosphotransferase n=1 Tax=Paenibacillus graminis TaxID=189425 RepID=A0A089M725_9BACL|nr:phosphotransferase [Paenibacillus graminis]AIQ68175.1 aminoglycoside phosphotransferase [Paenibacillus graminis]